MQGQVTADSEGPLPADAVVRTDYCDDSSWVTTRLQNGSILRVLGWLSREDNGAPLDGRGLVGTLEHMARAVHDEYVGDGVAIISTHEMSVLIRPPFSEQRLYYCNHRSGTFVFTDTSMYLRFLRELGIPIKFNTEYLANYLVHHRHVSAQTGFSGVRELLSGSYVLSQQEPVVVNRVAELVSNIEIDRYIEVGDALDAVRSLTHEALSRKIYSPYGRSLAFSASGGFDSSVLAGMTHRHFGQQERDVTLLNLYSSTFHLADERDYFRLFQARTGYPYVEIDVERYQDGGVDERYMAASFRPTKMFGSLGSNYALFEHCARIQADVLISGDGGDQLFLCYGSKEVVFPILSETDGISSRVQAWTGAAIRHNTTAWELLNANLFGKARHRMERNLAGGADTSPLGEFFTNAYRPNVPTSVPDPDITANLLTSQRFQYYALRSAEMNAVGLACNQVPERKPFLYWPLIKFMLRCPRGVLFHGGRSRGIGRRAFAEILPVQIAGRIDKSSGQRMSQRFDCARLLRQIENGPLADCDILDLSRLESPGTLQFDEDTASLIAKAAVVNAWMKQAMIGV